MSEKYDESAGEKVLLLGNEAIARGAYEAGVKVSAAYPGTPSTEISENLVRYRDDIYAEWSPNEKVAVEVAIGASLSGVRSMACMKHVGLNVASDPLYTVSYMGVNAGLVIVVADDPGIYSSQNEQDTRMIARAALVPVIEPSDSMEAKEFVKTAFEISERFDRPVIFRTTTRLAHSQSLVTLGKREDVPDRPYVKNIQKNVMMPAFAKTRHVSIEEANARLADAADTLSINKAEMNDTKIGVITSGIPYQYVKEALPEASVLKLGMVNPLPRKLITEFASKVEKLYVVEELEPVIEEQIRSWGIAVTGKEIFTRQGEYSVNMIRRALGADPEAEEKSSGAGNSYGESTGAGDSEGGLSKPDGSAGESAAPNLSGAGSSHGESTGAEDSAEGLSKPGVSAGESEAGKSSGADGPGEDEDTARIPARPPVLCPGCPHRSVYYVLGKLKKHAAGDIGCYTLGAVAPLSVVDTTICMGASISSLHGMEKARGSDYVKDWVAVIGDSTFLHTGINSLINMVYNKATGTVIILDNSTTGMTGHQDHAATGKTLQGDATYAIDLVALVKAVGVKRVKRVPAFDIKLLEDTVREETAADELSVIIAAAPCALLDKRQKSAYTVLKDKCRSCGRCLKPGCPAMRRDEAGLTVIDEDMCVGCGLCEKLCVFGAISKQQD